MLLAAADGDGQGHDVVALLLRDAADHAEVDHAQRALLVDEEVARVRIAVEEAVGFGKIGPAVRAALTGDSVSPDIARTLAALGREEGLGRLNDALQQTI